MKTEEGALRFAIESPLGSMAMAQIETARAMRLRMNLRKHIVCSDWVDRLSRVVDRVGASDRTMNLRNLILEMRNQKQKYK